MDRRLVCLVFGVGASGCPAETSVAGTTEGATTGGSTSGSCADVGCPAGMMCVDGVCMGELPCMTMPCCPFDSSCADGTTGPECASNEDCELGWLCAEGVCAPAPGISACDPTPALQAGAALPADAVGAQELAIVPAAGAVPARVVLAVDGGLRVAAVGDRAATAIPIRGSEPTALAIADMNGDRLPDIVVSDAATPALHVLLDDGAGGFAPVPDVTSAWSSVLAVGDLDGDGDSDVARYDRDDERLMWHENDGTGLLGSETQVTAGDREIDTLVAARLQRDADVELIATVGMQVDVWVDVGSGPTQFFSEPLLAELIVAAELDGDGLHDVVAASGSTFAVWRSGSGEVSQTTLDGGLRRLAHGDIDGDGAIDIVRVGDEQIFVWYGAGEDGCAAAYDPAFLVNVIAVADIDADDRDDIVIGNATATSVLSIAR